MVLPISKRFPLKITKQMFERYRRVQQEGRFNMLSREAQLLTGLDKDEYMHIIKNYGELSELYSE